MTEVIRITDQEIARNPRAAVMKAHAARDRGAVVEVPWHFCYLAMANPKFREQNPKVAAANARIQGRIR
jgi:hypothetical protein